MKHKQTKHSKRFTDHGYIRCIRHIRHDLQATALQTLQHPYVCGYKEFFVNWDREVIMYIILNTIFLRVY